MRMPTPLAPKPPRGRRQWWTRRRICRADRPANSGSMRRRRESDQLFLLDTVQHRLPAGQHDVAEERALEGQDAALDCGDLTFDPIPQDRVARDLADLQRSPFVVLLGGPHVV